MKHQQSTSSSSHEPATKNALRAAARKAEPAGAPPGLPSGGGREQIIRQTAYAFYEARGCLEGHDLEDWLKAEAQFDQAFAKDRQAPAGSGH